VCAICLVIKNFVGTPLAGLGTIKAASLGLLRVGSDRSGHSATLTDVGQLLRTSVKRGNWGRFFFDVPRSDVTYGTSLLGRPLPISLLRCDGLCRLGHCWGAISTSLKDYIGLV
jgi:hypothetical protein